MSAFSIKFMKLRIKNYLDVGTWFGTKPSVFSLSLTSLWDIWWFISISKYVSPLRCVINMFKSTKQINQTYLKRTPYFKVLKFLRWVSWGQSLGKGITRAWYAIHKYSGFGWNQLFLLIIKLNKGLSLDTTPLEPTKNVFAEPSESNGLF